MERLTERYTATEKPDGESDVWVRDHDYTMAAERLADYEDTGLTPEQIRELVMRDTAEGITEEEFHGVKIYSCPICNELVHEKDNFCCKCGQRLRREE